MIQHGQQQQQQNRALSTASSLTRPPLGGTTSIITGASRGIGAAIATAFASKGSNCILIGRDQTALNRTLEACNNTSNQSSGDGSSSATSQQRHIVEMGDISSREFWTSLNLKDLISQSSSSTNGETQSGPLILVNSAGVTHSSLLLRTSASQIESVIQTNLMGTLWASQIVGKQMLRFRGNSNSNEAQTQPGAVSTKGVIINVASLLATHGGAGSAAYAASKAGVLGLTRSLAAELGAAGIRVNAVLPGYIESDMTKAMAPKARGEALSRIPAGRFGSVDEIAEAAVFLASNAYANNCVITLDGGLSAV
ncbi:hypothetical protein AAFC00_000474 [Neodothiora populina]